MTVAKLPYESQEIGRQLEMEYPVLEYPDKLKSIKLERQSHINGRLMGIETILDV